MSEDSWILVDTETDGLRHPIHCVEIAAQKFEGVSPTGPAFRVFLDHEIEMPFEAFAVHGYSREFLKQNGTNPAKAYSAFWDYVNGARTVAHYASFDWKNVLLPAVSEFVTSR